MKRVITFVGLVASLVLVFSPTVLAATLEEYALGEGDRVEKEFVISNTGESSIEYTLWKSIVADGGLCGAIKMRVVRDGTKVYGGSLTDFPDSPGLPHPDFVLPPGQEHEFSVVFGLPVQTPSSYATKTCEFELGYETSEVQDLEILEEDGVVANIKITADYWTNPGDVVINEIAWAGSSTSTSDEWIELRNTRDFPISLTGWGIDAAGSVANSLALTGIVPAHGYFLISNFATTNVNSSIVNSVSSDMVTTAISLVNGGEQLVLRDSVGEVVDQTPVIVSGWAAGDFDGHVPFFMTMARNLKYGDGLLESNWHTCSEDACSRLIFWDVEGVNYGTPKNRNSN